MSTTSTNFSLVLATTSDTVSVVNHIANNFTTLDTILAVLHTGTGQLKSSITLPSPVLSGTMTGGTIIATTGSFQTLTATGGLITGLTTLTVQTITATGGLLTGLTTVGAQTVTATGGILTGLTTVGAQTVTATGGIVTGLTTLGAQTITATGGIVTGLSTLSATQIIGTTGTFGAVFATAGSFSGLTSISVTTGTIVNGFVAGTSTFTGLVTLSSGVRISVIQDAIKLTPITVSSDATAILTTYEGLFLIYQGGVPAISYFLGMYHGGANPAIISQVNFSTTSGNAGTFNVYNTATPSRLIIENKDTVTADMYILTIHNG